MKNCTIVYQLITRNRIGHAIQTVVKVIDGPFNRFTGSIDNVNDYISKFQLNLPIKGNTKRGNDAAEADQDEQE